MMIVSCKDEKYLHVYYCEPIDNDAVIRASNLSLFYNQNSDSYNIVTKTIVIDNQLGNQLEKVKNHIVEKGKKDTGMGIYYYSIIFNKDTLYSSSDLKSWKYKDLIGFYENDMLISSIEMDDVRNGSD